MADLQIFSDEYVGNEETASAPVKSRVKEFLKDPVSIEQMKKYGTSKPKRVLIKAKIYND